MKCPICQEKGLKSQVYPNGGTSTALFCQPYYDEDGKYHHHDMNTYTEGFSCSLGHKWSESSKGKCPSCDFGSNKPFINIINDQEIESTSHFGIDQTTTIIFNNDINSLTFC